MMALRGAGSSAQLMTSEAARGAVGYGDAMERMLDLHAEPLAAALARGADDGTLTSSDPYLDARSVLAIVDIVGERVLARDWTLEDARAHVRKFCWPALGLTA